MKMDKNTDKNSMYTIVNCRLDLANIQVVPVSKNGLWCLKYAHQP